MEVRYVNPSDDRIEIGSVLINHTEKNELKANRKKCWCIPPKHNAAFVAAIEDVLEVYSRPYDEAYPVVCMDEKPVQFFADFRMKGYSFSPQEERIVWSLSLLNSEGQQKAVERVEELAKIPRYRRTDAPLKFPEGKDTSSVEQFAEKPTEDE